MSHIYAIMYSSQEPVLKKASLKQRHVPTQIVLWHAENTGSMNDIYGFIEIPGSVPGTKEN